MTLRDAGFALSDGLRNGLWLPAEEGVARRVPSAGPRPPQRRLSPRQAKHRLDQMVDAGILQRHGQKRGSYYTISAIYTFGRRTVIP